MLHLLYPNVTKFCARCYKLNDNSIFIRTGSMEFAWWTICRKCGDRDPGNTVRLGVSV